MHAFWALRWIRLDNSATFRDCTPIQQSIPTRIVFAHTTQLPHEVQYNPDKTSSTSCIILAGGGYGTQILCKLLCGRLQFPGQ